MGGARTEKTGKTDEVAGESYEMERVDVKKGGKAGDTSPEKVDNETGKRQRAGPGWTIDHAGLRDACQMDETAMRKEPILLPPPGDPAATASKP